MRRERERVSSYFVSFFLAKIRKRMHDDDAAVGRLCRKDGAHDRDRVVTPRTPRSLHVRTPRLKIGRKWRGRAGRSGAGEDTHSNGVLTIDDDANDVWMTPCVARVPRPAARRQKKVKKKVGTTEEGGE